MTSDPPPPPYLLGVHEHSLWYDVSSTIIRHPFLKHIHVTLFLCAAKKLPGFFSLLQNVQTGSGLTQTPVEWVQGVVPR